jgi:hypothetical protein
MLSIQTEHGASGRNCSLNLIEEGKIAGLRAMFMGQRMDLISYERGKREQICP